MRVHPVVRDFHRRLSLIAPAVILAFGLSGCLTVGPDYEEPSEPAPDLWHQDLVAGLDDGTGDIMRWWETLGDPALDQLIARAREGNPTLKAAVAGMREARALRQIAAGERVPDVNIDGEVSRNRFSDDAGGDTPFIDQYQTFYSYGPTVLWEVDFWGRVRRSVASADANFQASIEDYRDALVLLYAEVALTYTEVRALQARIEFTLGNIETQRSALRLVQDRNRAGLASDLEVHQAELNLYRTESFLPSLRGALVGAVNRLGVLIGQPPGTLHAELGVQQPIPGVPADVLVGVPGELVRRRPDIRSAERTLASQTEQIGIATAALYPTFNILGRFAIFSTDEGDITEWDNRQWTLGTFFDWNLFDGGRVRGRIEVEDARTEQALRNYEQSVLDALEEVETAMSDYQQEQLRTAALERSVVAAERSVELVLILYRTGLTDFQNVLDMQRSLFEQQDELAESEGQVTQNLIRIYAALGGGWDPADLPELE
jgi:NodT family efflux transporter outer membrane factor (OMF) lipoprotein